MKKLSILLLFAAFVVSCGVKKSATIENNTWNLMELNGEKLDRGVLEDSVSYTISFMIDSTGTKQVNGKGECNYFFGGYSNDAEAKTIAIGNLGVTRAMCPNMEREDAYIKALMNSDTYEVNGDELTLKMGDKVSAKFANVPSKK